MVELTMCAVQCNFSSPVDTVMKLLIGCKGIELRECEADKPVDGGSHVKGSFHFDTTSPHFII